MRLVHLAVFAGLAFAARTPAQSVLASLDGQGKGDNFGHAVAFVGDLNGDGDDDFVVGAPFANVEGLIAAGTATIYSGRDHSVIRVLQGTQTNARFGWAVAGIGDINGDGVGEVAVGMPFLSNAFLIELGVVRVFDGATGAQIVGILGTQGGELFGYSVAGVGDWNGDGVPDFMGGGPYYDDPGPPVKADAGAVVVVSGATFAALTGLVGGNAGNNFGWSVAGVGDVSGGGMPDIAVGVPLANTTVMNGGRVRVYAGETKSLQYNIAGDVPMGGLGFSVAGGGDLDGDGLADVIGGAYAFDNGPGEVRTFLGPTGMPGQVHTGAGTDGLGGAVASVGDVDKDGFDDLAGGALQFPGLGYFSVWSGKTGGILYKTIVGQANDDEFGTALAGGGDANGDGWPDLLVGGDLHDGPGGKDSGRAYLYDTVLHQTNLGFQGPGLAKADAYGQPLATGNQYDIWLTNAKPLAQGWLVASATQHPVPFKGGTLVPDVASAFIVPLITHPDGHFAFVGLPGGGGPFDIDVQFLVKDATQVHGFELSNAVQIHYLP